MVYLYFKTRGEHRGSGDTTPCVKSLRSSYTGLYPQSHTGHPTLGCIPRVAFRCQPTATSCLHQVFMVRQEIPSLQLVKLNAREFPECAKFTTPYLSDMTLLLICVLICLVSGEVPSIDMRYLAGSDRYPRPAHTFLPKQLTNLGRFGTRVRTRPARCVPGRGVD